MSLWNRLHLIVLPVMLAACATPHPNTPMAPAAAARGIQIVRALPEVMPSQLSKVPDTPYLLVFAESTALALLDNLNPLPISITAPLAGAYQDHEAAQLKQRYAQVDPVAIVADCMKGSPLLTGRTDALRALPLVYLVEDNDNIFRVTLVLRAEGTDWMGRYQYHLPTTYSDVQVKTADAEMMTSLRRELGDGAAVLRGLIEREARGEFSGRSGRRVDFGSYHVVGSRVGGMMSASLMTFRNAEVLDEGADHVVIRAGGDPNSGAREGALAYGLHHFRKNQLHTFKVSPGQ